MSDLTEPTIAKRERLEEEDDDDDERKAGRERRKIEIKFITDKSRRHITFSKRKAGIMKKAYELSVLTGTQVLLLVVSETGLVYTFTTPKLQPLVTKPEGKNLIQACLNAPEEAAAASQVTPQSQQARPGQQQHQVVQQQGVPQGHHQDSDLAAAAAVAAGAGGPGHNGHLDDSHMAQMSPHQQHQQMRGPGMPPQQQQHPGQGAPGGPIPPAMYMSPEVAYNNYISMPQQRYMPQNPHMNH